MKGEGGRLARKRRGALLVLLLSSSFILHPSSFSSADIIAADNADNDPYPVSGFLPGDNGGYGFEPWVVLESGSPGSMFTATAIDDGTYSWGLSGTYALGRGLSNSMTSGTWRFLALHDPDNTAFSGFNLRSSTNIGSGFGSFDLLRFGMDPSQPGYDGSGIYVSTNAGTSYEFLDCGWVDGEGDTLEYIVAWDGGGSYSLTVSNLGEGVVGNFSGSMSAGSVAMLGTAVFGATANESVTLDDYHVIPEPAAAVLVLMGAALVGAVRRGGRR
ncbi:MAG: hypothetical protein JXQ75_17870 [Phycisphaerae bacterium]|nr:hypothetical protein [Phycisphaerae bacterium]